MTMVGFTNQLIDALEAEGILDGTECGEGLICPEDPSEAARASTSRWLEPGGELYPESGGVL